MTATQIQVVEQCTQAAMTGQLPFPVIISKLIDIGIERYHADYTRQEITYYMLDGASQVVPIPHDVDATAATFSASAVEAAVRQSQRNEHTFLDFIRKTKAAGCVGYFVQITGRRVIYFGRDGESHVEHFPAAPAKN